MKTGTYTAPLIARKLSGKYWQIDKPFSFIRPCGEVCPVPAGFVTDFASTDIKTPIGRGSKACITVPPARADEYFALFGDHETGKLIIRKAE